MFKSISNILGFSPKVDLGEVIKEGATILDVRTKGEFTEGHIKGSINISVDKLAGNINKLKSKDPIITCCASGARSAVARQILRSNGFTNVYNGGSWMSLKRKYSL